MDATTLFFALGVLLIGLALAIVFALDAVEPFVDHPDLKNIQWPVKPERPEDIERRMHE